MSIKAGRLRHRVTIQERQNTQNTTTGEVAPTWVDVHTKVPAEMAFSSVREFITSETIQTQYTARCTIRYREDLRSDMRILYKGKPYNVHGWLPDNDSGISYLTAPLSEGVNDG